MTALAIQPISFTFQESHDVRIEIISNEPWFCLKDVCDILGIKNSSDLLSKQLDKAGVEKIYLRSGGQSRQLAFVNEPNLYRVIFRSNKPEAKQFQDWVFNDVLPTIRKTGRYERAPAAEPLSPKDMQNLKNLVWMMTNGMKFGQAWNQAVWYCLRAATGRPSPQPFTVEDLPALAEECQRIMKITAAANAAMYAFEKDVIRRVVRQRGSVEPLIAEMTLRLNELHQQEQEGTLLLSKMHAHQIEGLVARH